MPSNPRSETLSRCRGVIWPGLPGATASPPDGAPDANRAHSVRVQVGTRWLLRRHDVAEHDPVGADVDHFEPSGGEVLAHVVGTYGELTMPTVDHHGELDGAGRPRSESAFSAARTVLPVKSTSSQSTTTAPSRSTGISVAATGTTGRSPMSSL